MSEPPAVSTADVDVAVIRRRFEELRKRQSSARRTLVATTTLVAALFAGFAHLTVNRVRDNFSEAAVQKAVAKRLPEVAPLAGAQLQKAAVNALPVYRDLAVERYEKLRPQLAERALIRLDQVPERTGRLMSERLDASFARVLQRIEPELRATFPSLTDEQRRDLLTVYFMDGIAERNQAIASHIEGLYTNELIDAHAALEKLDLPAADETLDPDQMQRDFLRSLLVLADYELSQGAPSPAPRQANRPTPPAAAPADQQASVAE